MCGIVGAVSHNLEPFEIESMRDLIDYRGPDSYGSTFSHIGDYNVGLGHRRLSIIDLSSRASQPMRDEEHRYEIVYNGEVYNYQQIRDSLEAAGMTFTSASDTEVVLKSYIKYGINCLNLFNGMFAFAILDRKGGELFLARDRYGIKPLYYYHGEQEFYFSSEIKALLKKVKPGIDIDALDQYLTFQNIFTNRTLFKGIKILEPGHYMTVNLKNNLSLRKYKYWQYKFDSSGYNAGEFETAEEVRKVFINSVIRQSISDVPIATYLSGGIDTGSIATVLSKIQTFSTFTCGFDMSSVSGLELAFDERGSAEEVSNLLKTEHYEVVLHAGDMEKCMKDLVWHLEDLRVGQCYPNYYAARLASKFVKVILSGTGGDEFFGGYPWRYYRGVNNTGRLDYLMKYYHYWQRLVNDDDRKIMYRPGVLSSVEASPFEVFCKVFDNLGLYPESNEECINASMHFEAYTFLHGLLVVDDKLSMAHGLEARVPFLDNELVDLAMRIPPRMKLNNLAETIRYDENDPMRLFRSHINTNDGKRIFRHAMRDVLPKSVIERQKKGFSGPDATWFRGDSIDYVNRMLKNKDALIYEYLDYNYVIGRIDDHIAGKVNNRLFIWSLLSLEWWLRIFLGLEYS